MKTINTIPRSRVLQTRRLFRKFAIALSLAAFCLLTVTTQAAQLAFSDFGPGNTYGSGGVSVGGQFINGFKFTSAATGPVSEIDVGIGGTVGATFNLNLYTDNAGTLGSSI